MMRVSVLMAVHNGARFLPETLASVAGQTLADHEFVIVDDCSGDATPAILALAQADDPRLRVIRNPANLGLTASLNIGLAACRGAYVARIDADDLALPQRLAVQAAFLDTCSDHVLVGARERVIDEGGRVVRTGRGGLGPVAFAWAAHFVPPIVHSSAMFRRSAGLSYDEACRTAQDFDLWQRMLQHGKASRMAEMLVELREHGGSISQLRKAEQAAMAVAIATRALVRTCPEIDQAALGSLAACVISGEPGRGVRHADIIATALAAEAAFLARTPHDARDRAAVRALTVNQLLKGASRGHAAMQASGLLAVRRPLATLAEAAAIAVRRWI